MYHRSQEPKEAVQFFRDVSTQHTVELKDIITLHFMGRIDL